MSITSCPSESETVVSQLARGVFGSRGVPYYAVQAGTMLILVLAANTAYADFPRLASILARDRYVPRQFMNQGDRLAFSNGIVGLSVFAGILLVVFGGDTHALIPLYMIGVFVSFTLSQAGMVVHWRRLRGPGWRSSAAINGVGALVTGIVLLVVGVTKAVEGAWIIMMLIPINVVLFRMTRQHYDGVAAQLTLRDWRSRGPRHNTVWSRSAASSAPCRGARLCDGRCPPTCGRSMWTSIQSRPSSCGEHWPRWGGAAAGRSRRRRSAR